MNGDFALVALLAFGIGYIVGVLIERYTDPKGRRDA